MAKRNEMKETLVFFFFLARLSERNEFRRRKRSVAETERAIKQINRIDCFAFGFPFFPNHLSTIFFATVPL